MYVLIDNTPKTKSLGVPWFAPVDGWVYGLASGCAGRQWQCRQVDVGSRGLCRVAGPKFRDHFPCRLVESWFFFFFFGCFLLYRFPPT